MAIGSKERKYERVWIEWIDSTMRKKVWWSPQEILDEIKISEKQDFMYSVGYLFKETKSYYYLCNSIHFEEGAAVSFGQIFSIPKGCAIQMKKI